MSVPVTLLSPPLVRLIPPDRFFIRSGVAAAGDDAPPADEQAATLLESIGPFSPGQLRFGRTIDPENGRLLVFAAHPLRLAELDVEEADFDWVGPVIAPLLAWSPDHPVRVRVSGEDWMAGLDYDGEGGCPVGVKAVSFGGAAAAQNPAEAWTQLEEAMGPAPAGVVDLESVDLRVTAAGGGRIGLKFAGEDEPVRFSVDAGTLTGWDIRDRSRLAARRRERIRFLWTWRAFAAGLALLAIGLVLELTVVAGRPLLARTQELITRRAPEVQRIETAAAFAARISELGANRLRIFTMLTRINDDRPRSIFFTRAGSQGVRTLEVEARTASPGDIGPYERILQGADFVESVSLTNLQTREGLTTFNLEVVFRRDSLVPSSDVAAVP